MTFFPDGLPEDKAQLIEDIMRLDRWGVPGNLVGGDPQDADHLIAVVPWAAVQETLHRWANQPEDPRLHDSANDGALDALMHEKGGS